MRAGFFFCSRRDERYNGRGACKSAAVISLSLSGERYELVSRPGETPRITVNRHSTRRARGRGFIYVGTPVGTG